MRVAAFAVLMALVGTAAADGTTFQGKVLTAETAAKSAHESRDPAAYEVCGQAYVEVANAAHTEMPDVVPEMLYNAAVCFQEGGSVGAAITLYARLEAEYPKHRLVPHALMRRAYLHYAIAFYAEAAKEMETYAAKYAGERDASDALENAFRLRAALGDDDAARADAERWIKMFGGKKVRDAASAALRLAWMTRERGKPEAAMREFREWIKRFGGRADRDQVVAAYVALGEIAWDASCKVKGTPKGGLCLAPAKVGAELRCGKPPMVVIERDAALVAEATKALQQAVRAAESASTSDQLARLYGDRAKLVLADARVEDAVRMSSSLPMPLVDATGRTTDTSARAIGEWIKSWQTSLGLASRALEPLMASPNQRVAIAAVGRIAWLSQHASDTLMGAPLPMSGKKKPALPEEMRATYCDRMTELAEPLRSRAVDAAKACLDQSVQRSVVDETAQCVAVFDRNHPAGAGGGERLPAAAWPRVRDVEREIRYQPPGTVTPSPP